MPRNATSKSSSKTTRTPRRSASKASENDALAMLIEDHKRVAQMFEEFEEMKESEDSDDEAKQMLVQMACAELTVHAQLEEEIFYPAAREAIDDSDLLDEAEVEHASAKQLITELSAMEPDDDLYDAKFTVLGEYVKHHVQEEEKELFPKIKKAKMDLEALGEEMLERKMALREELGLESEADEEAEDEEDEGASKSGKKLH